MCYSAEDQQPPCLYPGCCLPMEPHLLMCETHWELLPTALCYKLWRFYEVGVEVEPELCARFVEALRAAISHIRAEQGRRTADLPISWR